MIKINKVKKQQAVLERVEEISKQIGSETAQAVAAAQLMSDRMVECINEGIAKSLARAALAVLGVEEEWDLSLTYWVSRDARKGLRADIMGGAAAAARKSAVRAVLESALMRGTPDEKVAACFAVDASAVEEIGARVLAAREALRAAEEKLTESARSAEEFVSKSLNGESREFPFTPQAPLFRAIAQRVFDDAIAMAEASDALRALPDTMDEMIIHLINR